MVLLVVTLLTCLIFFKIMAHVFEEVIADVEAIILEELFPSDHLLLSMKLNKITY